jgi:CTP:phosphocholine cytidylyltransferase-like protein
MLFGEKMNRQNGILMSQQTIMEITGLSRASVQRGIKLLEDEKWVQPVKIGTAKAYVINSRVFWQADGKTKLASFSAQIVASAAEQDYKPEDWDGVRLRHFPILHSDERIIVGNEKLPPPDQGELSIA